MGQLDSRGIPNIRLKPLASDQYCAEGALQEGRSLSALTIVNGAMAVVRQAQRRPDKHPWVAKLLGRMSAKQAAIAIANKTARIAWAIMVHGGVYEAGYRAPQSSAGVRGCRIKRAWRRPHMTQMRRRPKAGNSVTELLLAVCSTRPCITSTVLFRKPAADSGKRWRGRAAMMCPEAIR
jgi:hypothetical protein